MTPAAPCPCAPASPGRGNSAIFEHGREQSRNSCVHLEKAHKNVGAHVRHLFFHYLRELHEWRVFDTSLFGLCDCSLPEAFEEIRRSETIQRHWMLRTHGFGPVLQWAAASPNEDTLGSLVEIYAIENSLALGPIALRPSQVWVEVFRSGFTPRAAVKLGQPAGQSAVPGSTPLEMAAVR